MRKLILIGDDPQLEQQLARVTAGRYQIVRGGPANPHVDGDGLVAMIGPVATPLQAAGQLHLVLHALPGAFSTYATSLALLLGRPAAGDALLVDCTLPVSPALAALDIGAAYTMAHAIRDGGRIDRALLDAALARHPGSGLKLLPVAADAAQGVDQLSPDDLAVLVPRIAGHFAQTVVDGGGLRHIGLLRPLVAAASHIHLLTPPTLPGVAAARALVAAIGDSAKHSRITLVVDGYDPGVLLSPRQMAQAIGLPRVCTVPAAGADGVNAINAGQPLVLSRPACAYARAIAQAAGLTPPPAKKPLIENWLRILTGRKGAAQ